MIKNKKLIKTDKIWQNLKAKYPHTIGKRTANALRNRAARIINKYSAKELITQFHINIYDARSLNKIGK